MSTTGKNRGKKNTETEASNHISDAIDIYYGTGVRITRAMKAEMEAKSSNKNDSGKGSAQHGAKKISSLNNKLSVRTSPRRKSATTKQNGQRKQQKGMKPRQNEVQKKPKQTCPNTEDKNDKTLKQDKVAKKHKPRPSSYEPSMRQMRVMRSLGLVAPLGSPFHRK